jgi:hypothetical protein
LKRYEREKGFAARERGPSFLFGSKAQKKQRDSDEGYEIFIESLHNF